MPCMSLILSSAKLNFVQSVKYLGIYMCAGKALNVLSSRLKPNFIVLSIASDIEVNMHYWN